MFKFFAKHSGKICTVLGVIGVVIGLGALIAAPYVVVPICVGITAGVFLGGALVAGACYIGREYGKYSERELNKPNEEKNKKTEIEGINLRSGIKHHDNELIQTELKAYKTQLNTITARVSKIEGEQKARFLHHSLEELHREREKYGIKSSSDSDSESKEAHLLSEQSIFTQNPLRNRRQSSEAANDVAEDIGVTPRHKKQQ